MTFVAQCDSCAVQTNVGCCIEYNTMQNELTCPYFEVAALHSSPDEETDALIALLYQETCDL